jgi:IS30 family transposase
MIEKKLNNRPRKMLGYQTPLEVFNKMAASKGVALRY